MSLKGYKYQRSFTLVLICLRCTYLIFYTEVDSIPHSWKRPSSAVMKPPRVESSQSYCECIYAVVWFVRNPRSCIFDNSIGWFWGFVVRFITSRNDFDCCHISHMICDTLCFVFKLEGILEILSLHMKWRICMLFLISRSLFDHLVINFEFPCIGNCSRWRFLYGFKRVDVDESISQT